MDDFVAGIIADILEDKGITWAVDVFNWVQNNVPPWLLPSIVFPALAAWGITVAVKKWRSIG